jgi:hypothetical protein
VVFLIIRFIGNLPDHDVGTMLIADYILFTLNRRGNYRYVKFFGLEGPSDCITTVLTKGAMHLSLLNQVKATDSSKNVLNVFVVVDNIHKS